MFCKLNYFNCDSFNFADFEVVTYIAVSGNLVGSMGKTLPMSSVKSIKSLVSWSHSSFKMAVWSTSEQIPLGGSLAGETKFSVLYVMLDTEPRVHFLLWSYALCPKPNSEGNAMITLFCHILLYTRAVKMTPLTSLPGSFREGIGEPWVPHLGNRLVYSFLGLSQDTARTTRCVFKALFFSTGSTREVY